MRPSLSTKPTELYCEYSKLLADAKSYNETNPQMSSWLMNGEHCFLVGWPDETLQERAISFVREEGGLDFLFDNLLNQKLTPIEVLIDAQILIYAGEYYKSSSEVINGGARAKELLTAAQSGYFKAGELKFPSAPIREKIENAAKRALASK